MATSGVQLTSTDVWYALTNDALDDGGYVMMLTSDGTVSLCTADSMAIGVAYKSTKDAISGTATADVEVPIVSHCTQMKVKVEVDNTDTGIAIGDVISMKGANTAGYAHLHVPQTYTNPATDAEVTEGFDELKTIVGVALAAVASPGSGSTQTDINCLLGLHWV